MGHSGYRWSGKKPAHQYLTGTNQLILFPRIKGECIEFTFVTDETKEKGVYSVIRKYTFKKVSVNSTSNSKKFTESQYLWDGDPFLINVI